MAECENEVYSNDYYDFIIDHRDVDEYVGEGYCVEMLDEAYDVVYYRLTNADPPLNITDYTYNAIPRCFAPLDDAALESSGILRVREQPNLALRGQGVLFGIIDTDFDYTNPLFCYADGSTRIERIWDQNVRSGMPPEGFIYGTEFGREQINEALSSENPRELIPFKNGHGTFLAAVAAGSEDIEENFSGAAPECSLAFVQLKPAKDYLKDFYFIPRETEVFQENDIMAGIVYLEQLATQLRRPLALCIALGTNMGNRAGNGPLAQTLNRIASRRLRCVTVAAGNEAGKRHHFLGNIIDAREPERVEINVSEGVNGFAAELWSLAPELYEVTVVSPTGERFVAQPSTPRYRDVYRFLFEETVLSVDYRLVGTDSNELIYMRFENPVHGIWVIYVRVKNFISGAYHIWLPMSGMLSGDVTFVRPNPDTTITAPADTAFPITAGGYNPADNSIYFESGRGFTATGNIKPDIVAPAVDVYGPVGNRRYGTDTGTSVAAAITAGAGALMLEWAGVRRNDIAATTVKIKNYFIRGAARDNFRDYPNREWGWGRLDVYETFVNFRNV